MNDPRFPLDAPAATHGETSAGVTLCGLHQAGEAVPVRQALHPAASGTVTCPGCQLILQSWRNPPEGTG